MELSESDKNRMESYEKIHLKRHQDKPVSDKKKLLEKRMRSKLYQIIFNFAIILFFAYSYYYNITSLGETFFYIIVIVFTVNVLLLFYQRKQIDELMRYYRHSLSQSLKNH